MYIRCFQPGECVVGGLVTAVPAVGGWPVPAPRRPGAAAGPHSPTSGRQSALLQPRRSALHGLSFLIGRCNGTCWNCDAQQFYFGGKPVLDYNEWYLYFRLSDVVCIQPLWTSQLPLPASWWGLGHCQEGKLGCCFFSKQKYFYFLFKDCLLHDCRFSNCQC